MAGLIMDGLGYLYGTTAHGGNSGQYSCYSSAFRGCGTVFELTAPATYNGTWQESILWSFGAGKDGYSPQSGLIDALGNLYGTTQLGGVHAPIAGYVGDRGGTVFEVSNLGE
jgi:hypothetical protein